ncbi:hypothetical protein [Rhodococcus koreensis]|uniref:hypothetical protein n=1 Tax=Rhodococcus koreensis TaxID=99653 RepID=UPI00197D4D74|nr:hypothetical protein [Rhodococcus koreensis]QSE86819.1 hypothetical protein JWS14_48155 [Rhodococcus koreensis]
MKKLLASTVIIASMTGGGVLLSATSASAAQLGSVNVQKYCEQNRGALQGNVSTTRNNNDAYSWRCVYSPPPPFVGSSTYRSVDMNLACRQQYSPKAWAKPLNTHDANSWRCYD